MNVKNSSSIYAKNMDFRSGKLTFWAFYYLFLQRKVRGGFAPFSELQHASFTPRGLGPTKNGPADEPLDREKHNFQCHIAPWVNPKVIV